MRSHPFGRDLLFFVSLCQLGSSRFAVFLPTIFFAWAPLLPFFGAIAQLRAISWAVLVTLQTFVVTLVFSWPTMQQQTAWAISCLFCLFLLTWVQASLLQWHPIPEPWQVWRLLLIFSFSPWASWAAPWRGLWWKGLPFLLAPTRLCSAFPLPYSFRLLNLNKRIWFINNSMHS